MKNNQYYFIKISSVLYYLLPIFLITGPFFPDFFLSIISGFLIYLNKERINKI